MFIVYQIGPKLRCCEAGTQACLHMLGLDLCLHGLGEPQNMRLPAVQKQVKHTWVDSHHAHTFSQQFVPDVQRCSRSLDLPFRATHSLKQLPRGPPTSELSILVLFALDTTPMERTCEHACPASCTAPLLGVKAKHLFRQFGPREGWPRYMH